MNGINTSNTPRNIPELVAGVNLALESLGGTLKQAPDSSIAQGAVDQLVRIEDLVGDILRLVPNGRFEDRALTAYALRGIPELDRGERRFLAELLHAHFVEGCEVVPTREMLRRIDAATRTGGMIASGLLSKGYIIRTHIHISESRLWSAIYLNPDKIPVLLSSRAPVELRYMAKRNSNGAEASDHAAHSTHLGQGMIRIDDLFGDDDGCIEGTGLPNT